MKHEKIELNQRYVKNGLKNNNFIPSITTYILDNYESIDINRRRPMIIVCPGGAYGWLSDREAEAVAIRMNSLGFNSCILKYSVAPMDYPAAVLDMCEAVSVIRANAKNWNTDENKIVPMGFSAGGHLCANFGTLWNSDFLKKFADYKPEEIKPNALCLCYPVITSGEFAHEGSIKNVLGSQFDDKKMQEFVSLETQVNKDVPPVFMWHTNEDQSVPLENSLLFATALRKNHIPFEYHVFTKGLHGLSLSNEETSVNPPILRKECAVWPELFSTWLKTLFN